ncbi:hypothetical protein SMC26_34655 [Actinomadura fulvescens]|uniref:Secreted protein n=1 Tax=Actinomadura fulvescens TaxID=46160 RepID=A0ABP6D727_9ACTN
MHRTRRLAVAVAGAALAAPLLSTPPAHADGLHECFSAERTPTEDGYYKLTANGCAGGGYVDVVVKVMVGPAAGSHRCRSLFSWNGFLSANGCRPA